MAIAKCTVRCFDSVTCRRYWPGDQDDLDPRNPVSKYFSFDDPEAQALARETEAKYAKEKADRAINNKRAEVKRRLEEAAALAGEDEQDE